MAFAGLKKQLNKANQFVSEKMGTAEGTKLTDEYLDMEKKTDVTIELVDEMLNKTKEFLQPNPAVRTKMQLSSRVGQTGGRVYSQPEGVLGESMLRCAKRLGDSNLFAQSLVEMGEALRQISEVKFSLEDSVKQNFLDPLTYLQNKEIKDVNFHRKKLESRRLDYDCKKRRKPTSQAEQVDLSLAQAKFEQSLNLASQGMHNLLQNQSEHINQLTALTQALYEYHSQCASILEGLTARLNEKKEEAANLPQEQYVHKKLDDLKSVNNTQQTNNENNQQTDNDHTKENESAQSKTNADDDSSNSSTPPTQTPNTEVARNPANQSGDKPNKACCKALYDFVPESESELPFKEGDIIELKQKVDDNWFEGQLNGRKGLFPITYVQVVVPLNK